MSSFSFSPPLQLSVSQLPPRPSPSLLSLPSELHAQPDVTSPLLPVVLEAATPSRASAVSLAAAF